MIRMYERIFVGWLALLLLPHCFSAAIAVPPLSELIDNYTQALESTQSMISSYESRTISSGYLPPMNMKHNNVQMYERGQRRTDGKGRIYHQAYLWGYNLIKKRDVPETKASYVLSVATSAFQYSHNKVTRGQANGSLIYKESRSPGWDNFRNQQDAFFLGYLGVDVRIDIILTKAKQIAVRRKPEIINGSVCYVVQAYTAYGDYTVWLDSTHGYQPARIEASKGADDIVNIAEFQAPPDKTPEAKETLVIDSIKFKKVQDVWVPVKGHVKSHIEWPKHGFFFDNKISFETTEIILNPDHDALDSFADPIKNPALDPELVNGTRVRVGEEGTRCVWHDGKLIDKSGDLTN